ncbi:hypothetical protein [Spirochaeta isovalerica]|uniref:Uncharacterized protein n=1 Tax=Spirochaeta isovalerica TaxID=150 RepID=A0A841RBM1_9SPIO|nr:hypothetical protein [Spirochaeta isovalerica]MBB6481333.1 hypothetical protein [Spirochaeta isovalerica]
MKIIRTTRLVTTLSLMIILTAALTILAIELKEGSLMEIKLYRENILFWGIIALSLQIWLGLSLFFNHRNLINDVRRLSRIGDFSQPQARKILENLGPLGKEMERMMREQNNLVHLRSNRISALNNLVKLLGTNYAEPIIISDVKGDILSVSGNLSEKLKKNNPDTLFNNVLEIRPDIPLPEVLTFMVKQRKSWSSPDIAGVTCSPVLDSTGEIHFCLWELETSRFSSQKVMAPIKSKSRATAINLRNLLGRIRHPGAKAKASPGSHESGQSDASGKP